MIRVILRRNCCIIIRGNDVKILPDGPRTVSWKEGGEDEKKESEKKNRGTLG